ncbi:putative NBD/HSP70 family sugar kinase [Amycolatopsis umgeniensis]|uniref:Putative NBD/HSP70 family sugar kinase n=2 Tax=Amycolatopsis umgeniensis TaxID=336628 RepID=A0A841AYH7_9PSEU|nr:ROK family protein [Amycolatopsis umgeniensis]MBB5851432.1 putative NBD/HSP70 family sugar kinase [Amycolatopsis umgeniensis]
MRKINQRAVLDLLRRSGPATRPQVAKDTGLSKPTVSQALLALEAAGLARATGHTSTGTGRSAVLYEADPTAGYVLGVDIGREHLRVAVSDLGHTVVARRDERNTSRSGTALVSAVGALAAATVREAGLSQADIVVRVLGSPGVADPAKRCFRHAPNLPGWGKAGLLDELEGVLGPDLMVENDANLTAVGEGERGAARGASVFACITIGTGVGMGVMVNGAVFRGATGAAGEIGYLPYGQSHAADAPPVRGHLEEATAAQSVVRGARELGLGTAKSAREVFRLARDGDELALRAVEAEADRLAYTVASVAAVIDPELIVLGGGIGTAADLLLDPLDRALRSFTPLVPSVVQGELGDDGVLTGAISVGLRAAEGLVFERKVGAA